MKELKKKSSGKSQFKRGHSELKNLKVKRNSEIIEIVPLNDNHDEDGIHIRSRDHSISGGAGAGSTGGSVTATMSLS